MSIEQDNGKAPRKAARTYLLDEASALAACKIPGKRHQEDAARIEKAKKHWGRFYPSFINLCDSKSKSILAELYPDRADSDVNAAMGCAECIARIRLFPEEYDDPDADIAWYEERLQSIIERRNAPAALAERRRIYQQHIDELQARRRARCEADGITLEEYEQQWMDAADQDQMDESICDFNNDLCSIRLALKWNLAEFYKGAVRFQVMDPDGRESFKRLVAKINGKSGATPRGKPRQEFQDWARATLKKSPNTSLGSLPERYVKETGSTISIGALRRYLTPSGGFSP